MIAGFFCSSTFKNLVKKGKAKKAGATVEENVEAEETVEVENASAE